MMRPAFAYNLNPGTITTPNKFITKPVTAFTVKGRVNEGGQKLPFCLEIEDNYIIRCTNSAGFMFSACIADSGNEPIVCVLADGTQIGCVMVLNRHGGRIRLDSHDAPWFWLEITPRF
jgi:hypothetical protein